MEPSYSLDATILTYGTFDLFHHGHLRLLKRLKNLGNKLIVGVSTDEFNELKGKQTIIPFSERIEIVQAIKYVDMAIPETSWNQKETDIVKYGASILGMGHDWEGKFDHLNSSCSVIYLPRTDGISSTKIKSNLNNFSRNSIIEMKSALDTIATILENLK